MIGQVLELVTPVSLFSSVLLGGMIGALYGYEIAPTVRARFPISLWTIGLAFIALISIFTVLDVDATTARVVPFAIGRSVLWTVVCVSIPAGRALRGWIGAGVRAWWERRKSGASRR